MSAVTQIDQASLPLTLTNNADKNWKGLLIVHRQGANRMILDGDMGQRKVHMEVGLIDPQKFPLVSRGFHWVQDYPFNK